MILGMTTSTFTLVHVLLSLVGIGTGLVVVYGLFNAKSLNRWTAIFLATTVLTSLTGFLFPNEKITPGIIVGILSMVLLALAIVARYPLHLAGSWRRTYVVTAMISLYLNVFVAIVQSFEKVPALHALAPTQKEAPFFVTQLVVMAAFIWATIVAGKRFQVRQEVVAIRSRAA